MTTEKNAQPQILTIPLTSSTNNKMKTEKIQNTNDLLHRTTLQNAILTNNKKDNITVKHGLTNATYLMNLMYTAYQGGWGRWWAGRQAVHLHMH